jgi:hypothetical protein
MLTTPTELLAALKRNADFNELMFELSGITGDVIPRFLTPQKIREIRAAAGLAPGAETPSEREWRHYREMTEALNRQMTHINQAIDRALERSEKRVTAARDALEEVRQGASIDRQGRQVYRTADGMRAYTDDGQEMTPEQTAAVEWRAGAPVWEERQRAGQRLDSAAQDHETILRYKDRADYYADRLNSGDILSNDDLDTIRKDLDAMPEAVRAEMKGDHLPGANKMVKATVGRLSGAFALSAADELAAVKPEPSAQRPAGPEFAPKL